MWKTRNHEPGIENADLLDVAEFELNVLQYPEPWSRGGFSPSTRLLLFELRNLLISFRDQNHLKCVWYIQRTELWYQIPACGSHSSFVSQYSPHNPTVEAPSVSLKWHLMLSSECPRPTCLKLMSVSPLRTSLRYILRCLFICFQSAAVNDFSLD